MTIFNAAAAAFTLMYFAALVKYAQAILKNCSKPDSHGGGND